jgi:hypothetical protein
MNNPIQVKKYNEQQSEEFKKYVTACKKNNVEPEPQKRYFALIPVNYGYILETPCNGLIWKRTKKAFN